MNTHGYFWRNAVPNHGVTLEEVRTALENEVERTTQPDGCTRIYGWVADRDKYLRVILLEDGRLFNAFPDSNYTRKRGRP